jgi:hypothetical protein
MRRRDTVLYGVSRQQYFSSHVCSWYENKVGRPFISGVSLICLRPMEQIELLTIRVIELLLSLQITGLSFV